MRGTYERVSRGEEGSVDAVETEVTAAEVTAENPCTRLCYASVSAVSWCVSAMVGTAGGVVSALWPGTGGEREEVERLYAEGMEEYKTKPGKEVLLERMRSQEKRGVYGAKELHLKSAIDRLDFEGVVEAVKGGAQVDIMIKIPRHSNENAGLRSVPAMRVSLRRYAFGLLEQSLERLNEHQRAGVGSERSGGFAYMRVESRYESLFLINSFLHWVGEKGVEAALLEHGDIIREKTGRV